MQQIHYRFWSFGVRWFCKKDKHVFGASTWQHKLEEFRASFSSSLLVVGFSWSFPKKYGL